MRKTVAFLLASFGVAGLILAACRSTPPCPNVAGRPPGADAAAPQPVPPGDVAAQYRKTVNHTIALHSAEMQSCYGRARIQSPQLEGHMTIAGTVLPNGHVADAHVADSTVRANVGDGAKTLESCLVAHVASWTFPPPPPGASDQIAYRLAFNGDAAERANGADAGVTAPAPDAGAAIIDGSTLVRTSKGDCVPWSQVASEPFVASPSDPLSVPAGTLLTRIATKIAGAWIGNVTVPMAGRSTGPVQIEFSRDLTYEGGYTSTSSSGRTAFGEVTDSSHCGTLRRWRLDGVLASGAFGQIDVPYGGTYQDGGTWCTPPGRPGKLERMMMNASATRLRFIFSSDPGSSSGRAVAYDLWRKCPSH